MAAAITAARRAHKNPYVASKSPLMGASGQYRLNNTLGGFSFDITARANSSSAKEEENVLKRAKSNTSVVCKTENNNNETDIYKKFPTNKDILKDVELDVVVGRKVNFFSSLLFMPL